MAVFGPDRHGGPRVSYFENDLLKVAVPEWVDPRGYQEVPSSVALPALLLRIQQPDLVSRRRNSAKLRVGAAGLLAAPGADLYDIAPDDQRFLMLRLGLAVPSGESGRFILTGSKS